MMPDPHAVAALIEGKDAARTADMEGAVNAHIIDHLAHGPVAHRDLMTAARSIDAELAALRTRNAELVAALEAVRTHLPCHAQQVVTNVLSNIAAEPFAIERCGLCPNCAAVYVATQALTEGGDA